MRAFSSRKPPMISKMPPMIAQPFDRVDLAVGAFDVENPLGGEKSSW
jgi:hypothetical protein